MSMRSSLPIFSTNGAIWEFRFFANFRKSKYKEIPLEFFTVWNPYWSQFRWSVCEFFGAPCRPRLDLVHREGGLSCTDAFCMAVFFVFRKEKILHLGLWVMIRSTLGRWKHCVLEILNHDFKMQNVVFQTPETAKKSGFLDHKAWFQEATCCFSAAGGGEKLGFEIIRSRFLRVNRCIFGRRRRRKNRVLEPLKSRFLRVKCYILAAGGGEKFGFWSP